MKVAAGGAGSAPLVQALQLAIVTGLPLGVVIVLVSGASLKWVLMLTLAGCVSALAWILGSTTRMLQALLIFSLSMGLDTFLGFSERFVTTRPGIPVTLTAMLLLCLYALAFVDVSIRKPLLPAHARSYTAVAFTALVAWAALSILVASRPGYVVQALPGYATALLLYLYAVRLMRTPADVEFTVRWIAIAVLISGVLGLVQYVTGGTPSLTLLGGSETQMVQGYQQEQISRVSGLLRHPNTFSVFLNGFLPLLLVLAWTVTKRAHRLLCAAAFGVGLAALVLTYSRGGWLSFGISLALIVMATARRHWRFGLGTGLMTVTGISMILVALVATPLYSRIFARVAEDDQGAASSRVPLARASVDLFTEHPLLGVGLNNYQFASPIVTDDRGVLLIEPGDNLPMRVHNIFLLTAVELGLPGVLLLAACLVLFLRAGIAVIRGGNWPSSQTGLGLTCGLVAVLTHCMIEPATLANPNYLILPFVGGCLTGLSDAIGQA